MSLLTDEEVKEIRLSVSAVCHHADLIRHTEKFIESKLEQSNRGIDGLDGEYPLDVIAAFEQDKRDAVPEGFDRALSEIQAENAALKEQVAQLETAQGADREVINALKLQRDTLQSKSAALVDAGNLVVETHNSILPIMNAYMGTLGTTNEWQRTCVASDALRAALAAFKGEK